MNFASEDTLLRALRYLGAAGERVEAHQHAVRHRAGKQPHPAAPKSEEPLAYRLEKL
jgi:hypothetical protein